MHPSSCLDRLFGPQPQPWPDLSGGLHRRDYFLKMKLEGAVVVVTGGASGLGEGTVRALVKRMCRVAVLDMNEEAGKAIEKELGDDCLFINTDITSEGATSLGAFFTLPN